MGCAAWLSHKGNCVNWISSYCIPFPQQESIETFTVSHYGRKERLLTL